MATRDHLSPARVSSRRYTLAGVASASVKEIAAIDGIGRVTAERLHATLHAGETLGTGGTGGGR